MSMLQRVLVFTRWAPVLFAAVALADRAPIAIDGAFSDWSAVAPALADTAGDAGASGIDMTAVHLADDDEFLFIRVEFVSELDLAEFNALRLYLDTDNNNATGLAVSNIGAELEVRLGDRTGVFYPPPGAVGLATLEAVRFRSQPTVTATSFEIAIARDVSPDGANALFPLGPAPTVRLFLRDEAAGDQAPDGASSISYTLDQGDPLPPSPAIPFGKERPTDLRVMTYNVLFDSPWDPGEEERFGRQLAAIQPDIVNFQEVFNHSAAQAAALVNTWVPLPVGESWGAAEQNDCITVSRFPIVDSWPLDGNLAVLIDATAGIGAQMLIINAHTPCCGNDSGRQAEIDRIMAFVNDGDPRIPFNLAGMLDLPSVSPILITGDLNLVGLSQQLTTLLTGDIINEGAGSGQFGFDFDPDWDGTPLTNLIPRHTHTRSGYTWRDDSISFWPGHLDFLIYSDSVIAAGNHFVLNTPDIPTATLAANNLLATDSLASDHRAFVVDFRPTIIIAADFNNDGVVTSFDLAQLLGAWGASGPADLNGDGVVGSADLALLLGVWGVRPF